MVRTTFVLRYLALLAATASARLAPRQPRQRAGFVFTIVQQGSVKLKERFGQYRETLEPGFHWMIPFIDRAFRVPVQEIVLDTPPQNCITADNAPVAADAVVYYKIFDPTLASYGVQNLDVAISNLVKTQVRSEIGKLELDATFSAREALSSKLLSSLDVATDAWGVKVTRVEIQEIRPNADILRSMEQVMSAERDKRAAILRSEGQRAAQVNGAAADADSAVQAAEAEKTSAVLAAQAAATGRELQAEAEAAATIRLAKADAEAARLRGDATRDALAAVAEGLGGDSARAAQLDAVREYTRATMRLAASPNAKTVVLPQGDDWLAKIGIGLELGREQPKLPNV